MCDIAAFREALTCRACGPRAGRSRGWWFRGSASTLDARAVLVAQRAGTPHRHEQASASGMVRPFRDLSDGNEGCSWTREERRSFLYSGETLAKRRLCPSVSWRAEFATNKTGYLAEEVSKPSSEGGVWSLLTTHSKAQGEMTEG